MAMAFWTPWALWIKLCFILGGAIVLIVLIGFMKRLHNHWKLRSYTKLETSKAAITQEITQQMQHFPSVRRGRAHQVPFGVRALESGIEVDGVWISRPNTPTGSLPGSPRLSGTTQLAAQSESSKGRPSSSSIMSSAGRPQPPQARLEVNRPSSSSSTVPNPLDRPVRQYKQPPTSDHQSRGRTTYQPRRSSQLRFSNPSDLEDPEALAAVEGHPMLTEKDGKRPEVSNSESDDRRPSASWSGSSRNSGNESSGPKPQNGVSSTAFLHPEYRNPSTGRMQTYKLYDLNPVTTDQQSHMDGNGQLHFRNSRASKAASHDIIDGSVHSDSASFDHADSDPLGVPDGCIGNTDVPVSHEDDDIADQHTHLMDANELDYDGGHAQPLRPFDGNRQARNNQILRKVNSNFQILRPGTLDAPRPNNDHSEWQVDLEAANKRSSRKLQKRGRASSKSSYTLER